MVNLDKAHTNINFICGLVLLITFIITAIRITNTSKSKFAFTMIAFTLLYSINDFLIVSINVFNWNEIRVGWQVNYYY